MQREAEEDAGNSCFEQEELDGVSASFLTNSISHQCLHKELGGRDPNPPANWCRSQG